MNNDKRSQPVDLAPVLAILAVLLFFVLGNCGPDMPLPH